MSIDDKIAALERRLSELKAQESLKCAYKPCDGQYVPTNDIRIAQMNCPAGYVWKCSKCGLAAPSDRQAIIYKITKAK